MKLSRTLPLAAFLVFSTQAAFGQGALAPPGAPAPSMKTLDQIASTGIALNAVNTPGDNNNYFIITKPGNYYLTGDLAVVATNGISVRSDNVVIDLNGFQISGTGTGIGIFAGVGLTVKNGCVTGFAFDVQGTSANTFHDLEIKNSIYGLLCGDLAQVERVRADGNTETGIQTGSYSIITKCSASQNGLSGMNIGAGSSVTNCTASLCSDGIRVADGSTVSHCAATQNKSSGITTGAFCAVDHCIATLQTQATSKGISVLSNCAVSDCNASKNMGDGIVTGPECIVNGCTASANGFGSSGTGIAAAIRTTIHNCIVTSNQLDGIAITGDCAVTNCHAIGNGQGARGAGIHVTLGSGNLIEGNLVRDNSAHASAGIIANSADIVTRNSLGGNATNLNPATGANFGPVQSLSTSTSPFANVVF